MLIFLGDPTDTIVARLLGWSTQEEFTQIIAKADLIEGDEYERIIVEVSVDNDEIKHGYIYVSKSRTLDKTWIPIPSGDWLQRQFK